MGHTFGHAIELDEKSLSHGEAVAIGMLFALYVSEQQFNIDLGFHTYLTYLKRLNFPLFLKQERAYKYMNYMLHDKKNEQRQIRFVLLKEMNQPVLMTFTEENLRLILIQFLSEMKERRGERMPLNRIIKVAGDKSITHRAIILSSLAKRKYCDL